MEISRELKKIKKVYGEDFMKLCRSLFPTILEKEGRLYEILSSTFSENSKTLCEDIVKNRLEENFKDYIYSKIDAEDQEKKIIVDETPYELLEEVGYNLTECLTEEQIQGFRKYYQPGEELCTFEGGRLNRCIVFWAVKNDAEKMHRKKFKNPKREDKYGTSVMSIQFSRKGICTVSIKNRYNETVNNPDATYGNDLDRIIPGLTKSFSILLEKEYGLKLNNSNIEQFTIPGYVVANDGKYYKYNMEINEDYYCPGNIIIEKGGQVKIVGKPEEGVLIDYFYINKKEKKIELPEGIEDSFVDGLKEIKKIEVVKSEEENINREIKVYLEGVEQTVLIGIDKNNQIVKYVNNNVTEIGECFLYNNRGLTQLELPNLEKAGDDFLLWNKGLTQLGLPNLRKVENGFLFSNEALTKLELPKLGKAEDEFLYSNEGLTQLELPNLRKVGNGFLCCNKELTQLELPNLRKVGADFLYSNEGLTKLELPNLREVGNSFLFSIQGSIELKLPNLKETDDIYLMWNEGLTKSELPKLRGEKKLINIDSEDIAKLDKNNELTTSEISFGRRIIEKIIKFFKKKDSNER